MAALLGVRTLPSLLSAKVDHALTAASRMTAGTLQLLRSFVAPPIMHRGPRPLLQLAPVAALEQSRSITKFNMRNGQRRTCKAVVKRFMRLNCGLWIRPRSGRAKNLWKKPDHILEGLRTHVFCNRTQCKMLDKMVGDYWKRPKYYVDDPYEPYHERNNFLHAKKTWW